jgi:O-antigen/teichoic acid export membrane protein
MDRDQLTYVGARGVYSLLQFAALIVFSRLLVPSQYGLYAIGLASAFLGNAVFFKWIKHSVLRFSTAGDPRSPEVLAHARDRYLAMALLVAVVGLLASAGAYVLVDRTAAWLAVGTALVLALQGFFEIHLEYRRSIEASTRYALGLVTKAGVLLVVGAALALGLDSFLGPLAGVAVGFLVGGLVLGGRAPTAWASSPLDEGERQRVRDYGLPLAVMFVFTYAMSQVDRILLGALASSAAAGVYSVAYDIARQAIFVPLMAVSLVYFPRMVEAYQGEMGEQVTAILSENVHYLLALGIPAAVGISLVAEPLLGLLLDPAYAETGATLIPFVAAGAFLLAVQEFTFNRPFQLAEVTRPLSVIHGAGAVFNVLANLVAIPLYGVHGAAGTTVATYLFTFVVKWYRAREELSFDVDVRLFVAVGLATAAMAGVLVVYPAVGSLAALAGAIALGALVYLATLGAVWRPELPEIG